jgi:molybdopterin converting factor small subunit
MRIHLGGHLAYYQAEKQPWSEVALGQPLLLAEAARRMNVPEAEVALWVVNGAAVDPRETMVCDTDIVQLFPPVDGG